MKVVIVGCGKVGKTIAEELVKENHDIILIDENAELVEDVSNSLDIIGAGSGSIDCDHQLLQTIYFFVF